MSTAIDRVRPGSLRRGSDPDRAKAGRDRTPIKERLTSGMFLLPAVLLVTALLTAPFVSTVYRSFFDDRFIHQQFAGIDNYRRMFSDAAVLKSLLNTLMWLVGTVVLPIGLGIAIAVMTNAVKWGKVARLAIVLPYAISGSAVAVVWNFMLQSDGAINTALKSMGLGSLAHDWLLNWPMNTIVMIIANAWQATGVAVILFLVGLQAIPPETIEAGAMDGAIGWQRFRHIVFPQLRAVTVVIVGISLVNGLKAFDLIWVLSQGGPARSTETLAVSMYWETFVLERPGSGAAVAVVLTIVVVAVSWVYLRRQLRQSY
ncbi:MAG TPA: sugar ABC transporter permease [Mycobacteriales bacterium]|jgi:multiple sugar transport system permease protein|nr:sugar ABC transporter permease [Mycobacteriales bacterium]